MSFRTEALYQQTKYRYCKTKFLCRDSPHLSYAVMLCIELRLACQSVLMPCAKLALPPPVCDR
jgi:hypothetical protein